MFELNINLLNVVFNLSVVDLSIVLAPLAVVLLRISPVRTTTAIAISALAIGDRDLSDGAVRVLFYLMQRTADCSELVMRHQDIAAELNRSISTVARSLDELSARGYIARGRDRSVRGGPARIRVTERARAGRAGSMAQ